MAVSDKLNSERRQYIRLDTVFPVQFCLVSSDGKSVLSDILQGFTSNVGKGGLCLEVNNLSLKAAKMLEDRQADLSLEIEMPFTGKPVAALAKVGWVQGASGATNKYLIGLAYKKIDALQSGKIVRYALMRKMFIPSALAIILILGLAFAAYSYLNVKLIKGNRALVGQLIDILQETSIAKEKIKVISKEKDDLQLKIQALHSRIQAIEEEKIKLSEEAKAKEKAEELAALVGELTRQKNSLQEQLISLQQKENSASRELLQLDQMKTSLTQANLDKMYLWLKVHQSPRTGLVLSYEGDNDMSDWAFTYDQALMIEAYTYFSDFDRAQKILDFFQKKAKRANGMFFNAYYANGGEPAESIAHSGPNIWLGMAVLQYTKKTNDRKFLDLAEEIAGQIILLQDQDKDGGIRGGADINWYATEHNLDAYAFFNMLSDVTGKSRYGQASQKVLQWLITHTYDHKDIPIKRGKGDATIATDTYAWSMASIGPEKLEEIGMDPEKILEFAEENCKVETSYLRPDGAILKVKGFDFAAQRHSGRGGIVSSEWTAQMVLAFKIIADFYYKKGMPAKAASYELKANEYLGELANMIISSPSPSGQGESCLPYATQDMADTGHGWMTPKGKSTGSVAGTAWTLFAYYKYNPLKL